MLLEDAEPNLTPVMNLMVVIIPLLLTSAQFLKISVIDLNLPPAATAQAGQVQQAPAKAKKLELAITITDHGFFISSKAAILKQGKGPSVPKRDGMYDFAALSEKLYEIKQKAAGRFEDDESVVIQAEPEVDYQTLVSTMDAARSIKVKDQQVLLFPKVSVSAALL